jgi:hypothetical protein
MNQIMSHEDLVEFSSNLKKVLLQSDHFTNLVTKSIDLFDSEVNEAHRNVEHIFSQISAKQTCKKNLELCEKELQNLLHLLDLINADKLEVSKGHMGQIDEYISKLECIKAMENKYAWIQDLEYSRRTRIKIAESDLKTSYNKYKILMRMGENILCQEFTSIINHYSTQEQMQNYFDFLLNKFENDETLLFISNQTTKKLESICYWFLEREQQSELYDEKNEHCDINKKLKFAEHRNQFLKLCIKTYFKRNSVKDLNNSTTDGTSSNSKKIFSYF